MILAAAAAEADVTTWKIDPAHSSAEFVVRHMMVSRVRGRFEKLSGTVVADLADPSSAKVDVLIDAASIDTSNSDRDNHLRSPDFFDVEKFPTITFRSKRVEKASGGLRITGDLTMHGVTKEVVLSAETPQSPVVVGTARRSGVSATTRVNRKDYGLMWNRALEAGGVVVGDDVDVLIEVALVEQPPAAE
jgi:polyisoprenoid-binding protein YceI